MPKSHPGKAPAPVQDGVRMLAIDPGEVHCGYALFNGGDCYEAGEWRPHELMTRLEGWMRQGALDEVVIEDYRLYPDKSKQQAHSQMFTVRVIGALEFIVARFGGGVPVIFQRADIKKATVAQNEKRGYQWKSRGHGGHAKDAETHGLYRNQKGRNG